MNFVDVDVLFTFVACPFETELSKLKEVNPEPPLKKSSIMPPPSDRPKGLKKCEEMAELGWEFLFLLEPRLWPWSWNSRKQLLINFNKEQQQRPSSKSLFNRMITVANEILSEVQINIFHINLRSLRNLLWM